MSHRETIARRRPGHRQREGCIQATEFTGAMLDHAAAVEEEPPGIDTATLPKLLDPVAFIASQVIVSLVLGILLGGISGYLGGTIDLVIQRAIELLQAIPRIPLWLTLSAALPRDWGTVEVYFGITIILSVLGWTGLARTVRGKFLALREEDFTQAAKYLGASEMRIIIRHMVPSFSSHLIAVLTLRVPEMILAETSLSFLGLGLREPVISWGVLLTGVQNIRAVALAPWLFLPGVAIVVTVLAFNFVGDGLRDADAPYAQ